MTARVRSRSEHLQKAQLALIDAIYGAVADPHRWGEVARAATRLIGDGPTGLLIRRGKDLLDQELVATNVDPAFAESYAQHYGAINPWARVIAAPANSVRE